MGVLNRSRNLRKCKVILARGHSWRLGTVSEITSSSKSHTTFVSILARYWDYLAGVHFLLRLHHYILNYIESIQRRATRLICGSVKSYSERLAEINWSTLELRRKYLCLVQLYKIIHGFSDVDYTRYIDLTGPTRTRRNHDFKIRPRAVRTNYFKFSFFNRYVNDWNSLPNSVMSASSLNAFKNRLLNYLCT